ncbi:TPA: N-6 DNA methylase [Klebsiella pneumoniae]
MTTETAPEKISLDELKSWLWGSANIMRGTVDSSDFKNYIFGLIFLKRLSDVFDERVAAIMKDEKCSETLAMALIKEDNPEQFVPEQARWSNLVKKTENVGESIDEAFAEIERQNPSLEKVLTAIQFGDKDKLSNELLMRLLRHFNRHKLGNKNLYKADLLGDAYEYLIGMFADDAGKKGGEFYTPHGVVELIVKLIDPKPGHEIYDPTCGCGGMLVEAANYIRDTYPDDGVVMGKPNCKLYGQEKNLGTWAIAKLNMFLHNLDGDIRRGDTLVNPQHLDSNNGVMPFDRVIANPPFSSKEWWEPLELNKETKVDKNGKETEIAPKYATELKDPFGRFGLGVAPRTKADLAFVQHMITSTREDGRIGVVVPHGVLFREGEEGKIRQGLLVGKDDFKGDLIEAVIGLPPALFFNTGISAAIVLINKAKPAALKDKVIFIDASSDYEDGKSMNYLRNKNIENIVSAYRKAKHEIIDVGEQAEKSLGEVIKKVEIKKYLRIVEISEIIKNKYTLSIGRYIDQSNKEDEIDILKTQSHLDKIKEKITEIDCKIEFLISGLTETPDINLKESSFGKIPTIWNTVKLGDYTSKIGSGITPKGGSKAYVEQGIPLLRSQNILHGKLKLDDVAFISNVQHNKMKNSQLQERDVLLNITGASIGRCAVLPNNFNVGNVNQHVCIIRTSQKLQPEFCGIFLNSHFGQKQIWNLQAGGNREGLNFQQIRSFEIHLPPLNEQKRIVEIFNAIDTKLDLIEQLEFETQNLKKGLMQKLLTGEWRVPLDCDEEAAA